MDASVIPFGSWSSPITPEMITAGSVGLGSVLLNEAGLWWTEARPEEGGRTVVVHRSADGAVRDVFPSPFYARSRVHEYGGGAVTIVGEQVFFVDFRSQAIHRTSVAGTPVALTEPGPWRFASMVLDETRRRLVAVRESHGDDRVPTNDLVAVPLDGGPVSVLHAGHDFYAAPRLSPDGRMLVWLTWDLPDMPWDATMLWRAAFRDDGTLGPPERLAGGAAESVFQPEFAPNGDLHVVSDRETGWWNHYRIADGRIEPLCAENAEYGAPMWSLGAATYTITDAGRIFGCRSADGLSQLGEIRDGGFHGIDLPFTAFGPPCVHGNRLAVMAASATQPNQLIEVDLSTGDWTCVRRSLTDLPDPRYLSLPEPIEFRTGADGAEVARAFYYPPKNDDAIRPGDERPPLIVCGHGGPTGASSSVFNLGIQYWTSRGFAVVDVNYRGSTGWGRGYREALYGQWGIADVEDCVNAARALVERGVADPARLAIRGGSAGGYTVLAALAFHDTFTAGCSLYGIGDLEALAADTHKFESRYLDRLVGAYPQERETYIARSPIHHVDGLSVPVIFFQGMEDKVVPPAQAETMVSALRTKGVHVAHVVFDDEGHGFRKAENIRQVLDDELAFYRRVWAMGASEDPPAS